VPFLVKIVPPEQACVRISWMIAFAVQTFESVGAWFTLFSFKTRVVGLEICFVVPGEMLMMPDLVRFITLNTL